MIIATEQEIKIARLYRESCARWTPDLELLTPDLAEALRQAIARVTTMTDCQIVAMMRAQRESFIRCMTTPCEHGKLDFEQCGACRA